MKVVKSLFVGTAVAAVALATSANAVLLIDWSNPNGYFDHNDNDVGAAEALGGALYGMLILVDPGGSIGAPVVGNLTGGGTMIVEGDLVADGGGDALYGFASTLTTPELPYVAGSQVFARVFEAPDAGSVTDGTWYYDGPLAAVQDVDTSLVPPPPAQLYIANRDSANSFGGQFGGDALSTGQVVPEPGTLALLGIGALTVFLRRRRS